MIDTISVYLQRDTAFSLCLISSRETSGWRKISFYILEKYREREEGGEGASDTHILREQGWRPRGNFATRVSPKIYARPHRLTMPPIRLLSRLSSTLSPRKLSHTPDNLCVRPFRHLLHENSSATFHHVPPSFLLAESTFSTRPIFPYFLALKHAKDIKNRTC